VVNKRIHYYYEAYSRHHCQHFANKAEIKNSNINALHQYGNTYTSKKYQIATLHITTPLTLPKYFEQVTVFPSLIYLEQMLLIM